MPRLQTLLSELNSAFGRQQIAQTANASRSAFAPGQPLADAVGSILAPLGLAAREAFSAYVSTLPPSIQESLRSTIFYALGTDPPTLITFPLAVPTFLASS